MLLVAGKKPQPISKKLVFRRALCILAQFCRSSCISKSTSSTEEHCIFPGSQTTIKQFAISSSSPEGQSRRREIEQFFFRREQ
ncbi:hypothetical protein RvY_05728 [Ramazzottius varieornatus]|uniref:Uncharacterized protein n=1 Tax=Ramazzottius varieornatus TaxID=947166 RepID=A0A1D1UZ16_RAMVA|nr:hypothetical protein RvY_05728 [Ramazzottius varieornatus]